MLREDYDNKQIQRDLDTLQEQVRALNEKNASLEKKLDERVQSLSDQIFQNAPPFVNYVNNGDFVFEQEDYEPGTNYTDDHLDCAHWYQQDSTDTTQITEHTTTVRSNEHISTNTGLQTYWDKTAGQLVYGSRCAIYTPLPKNLGFPASSLFCRFQVKKFSGGVSITDSWRLRASIWDNTSGQQKIIEGAVFDLTVNAAVPSPGSFTRKYILKVDTSMDFFFSDVLTPSQVTNQVSVTNTDNVNFVNVSWQVFPEAARYRLYRHDSEFNEWRLIADIVNGATSFKDVGGRTGALFIPPGANILPRAQALFVNFGKYVNSNLNYQDVIFHIFVPTTYNYGLTTAKQFLRIDMVDQDLNFVTLPDDALIFDKVALGYTNGRFTYSSRDLQANATVAATTPPPTPPPGGDDGDGGNIPPPRGRGDQPFCVWYDTMILVQFPNSVRWIAAKDVEVGHYLVNIKGDSSKVVGVIKGTSDKLHILTTLKGMQIECSPSHRIITTWEENDPGTPAHLLKTGDRVAIWNDERIEIDEITSVEILDTPGGSDVITFTLEGEHTYIAGGVFSHNLKPLTA